jgi:hypothetical protein
MWSEFAFKGNADRAAYLVMSISKYDTLSKVESGKGRPPACAQRFVTTVQVRCKIDRAV